MGMVLNKCYVGEKQWFKVEEEEALCFLIFSFYLRVLMAKMEGFLFQHCIY